MPKTATFENPVSQIVEHIVSAMPLRATGFIVTLYGDAVVPRGGEVWMGTIIEICALVGISETLVRTAVSRLVSAGQLIGVRRGRRSFYRLTDAAQVEFAEAARLIYGPADRAGWRFVYVPDGAADKSMTQLERQGYTRLRAHLAVGPARGPVPAGLLAFDGEASGEVALLPEFAALTWDLARHAQAYSDLVRLFTPVLVQVADLTPPQALALRLLLIHAWRSALQSDPRLPASALPPDWPGHEARRLMTQAYLALSTAAESHLSLVFEGIEGHLQKRPQPVSDRLLALTAAAKSEI